MSISIEKVSYKNSKDCRILEAALNNWFKNPKELNFIDPRMSYPFNFKKWVLLYYNNPDIKSFACKYNNWIIGISNIKFIQKTKRAHAFHIFVDQKYREQGLATKMLQHLESQARDKKMNILTINVLPKNKPAKKLYERIGFEAGNTSKSDILMLKKILS